MKLFNEKKPVILDGSMGTMLQKAGMLPGTPSPMENLQHPNWVRSIQEQYIQAGSQAILSNTFGADPLKMPESYQDVIAAGLNIAKTAADGSDHPVLVGLDVGPLGQMLQPYGPLSFEKAKEAFVKIIEAGKDQTDFILIETMTSLQEAKAAYLAAREVSSLPVWVSMSFEADGRTFMGTTPAIFASLFTALQADAIGINCSTGPDQMIHALKELLDYTNLPVFVKPNAGLPDPITGGYSLPDETFAKDGLEMAKLGLMAIGGCCGTTPNTIAALTKAINGISEEEWALAYENRKPKLYSTVTSATKLVSLKHPVIIGERINPTGKKRMQQALRDRDMDYLIRLGLQQEEAGAHLLDVNVGAAGVNEEELLPLAVSMLQEVVSAPLVLDSSDIKALEKALEIYNGKPLINSTNASPEKMEQIFSLAKKYGAAVVGLCMDESGIPDTAKKRIELAEVMLNGALEYHLSPLDLWIDPLTLTLSAQPDQARESLKALSYIDKTLHLATVLGVSNISFGLPARPVLNAAFLQEALACGLKAPILNPNETRMMDAFAAHLLLEAADEMASGWISRMADHEEMTAVNAAPTGSLQDAIMKGLKEDAARLAREKLKEMDPLQIVSQLLVPSLEQVGTLYEQKKVFLPGLLGAAAAAKNVFDVLKEEMAKNSQESTNKGTIVLATVKGDIHDIGKNIVKTVLENYGYEVIDLGKDVPVDTIVETVKEKDVKLVGLSALMTTTLKAMEESVQALSGLENPPVVMVGGAVVTADYAKSIGAVYSDQAMDAVRIAQKVFGQ